MINKFAPTLAQTFIKQIGLFELSLAKRLAADIIKILLDDNSGKVITGEFKTILELVPDLKETSTGRVAEFLLRILEKDEATNPALPQGMSIDELLDGIKYLESKKGYHVLKYLPESLVLWIYYVI